MDIHRQQKLSNFLLKCRETLTHFKKKQRDDFLQYGDTHFDNQVSKLSSLIATVENELRGLEVIENTRVIDDLHNEYETLELNIVDLHNELVKSIEQELQNVDKEIWYNCNFDGWKRMPDRQEYDSYPLPQQLRYSRCRLKMFEYLEREWKKRTFPTLHDRLEFF